MRYLDESLAPMVDRIVDNWDTIFDENTLTKLHNVIGKFFADRRRPTELHFCHSFMLLGIPPVIVHGDLWNANLIWKKHNGKRTLAAIIDWQMAHPGCAAEDIARIICCALTSKDRREHWRDILEYYYRKLGEKMRKEPPLSFNQVSVNNHLRSRFFIRVYPLTMCIISSAFGPLMRLDIQMKCPDRVDELTAAMHEKACHLLEDGLNYYSKNAEKNA
ncbi:unnamed protein product [Toxocara canis]|uniref:CHK domain-containing protein n=1 Tax=Toxocara canis TaxID=6265 RepID=A0A183TZL3_TOXCA|nr:unnamed protein product [Toxocara canis]